MSALAPCSTQSCKLVALLIEFIGFRGQMRYGQIAEPARPNRCGAAAFASLDEPSLRALLISSSPQRRSAYRCRCRIAVVFYGEIGPRLVRWPSAEMTEVPEAQPTNRYSPFRARNHRPVNDSGRMCNSLSP